MKYLRVLLILSVTAIIFVNLNVNSAFVAQQSDTLINAYNNNNLVRLHVIAASNSPDDQYLKRRVRDEVTNFMAKYAGITSDQLDFTGLQDHLEEFLRAEGVNYPVKIKYGNFYFPCRTYGNVTLPAGDYKALRVILGQGEGANWWCVLLPPLCIDSEKSETTVEANKTITNETISKEDNYLSLDKDKIAIGNKLEFRLRIVDLLKKKGAGNDLSWTGRIIKKINFLFDRNQEGMEKADSKGALAASS